MHKLNKLTLHTFSLKFLNCMELCNLVWVCYKVMHHFSAADWPRGDLLNQNTKHQVGRLNESVTVFLACTQQIQNRTCTFFTATP